MSQGEVEVLPGIAPWVGRKRCLAARIGALINETAHECYCEPFVGMGGVFFRRKRRPHVEVINDWSQDVVNLFRVLKHHSDVLTGNYPASYTAEWNLNGCYGPTRTT